MIEFEEKDPIHLHDHGEVYMVSLQLKEGQHSADVFEEIKTKGCILNGIILKPNTFKVHMATTNHGNPRLRGFAIQLLPQ